MRNGCRTVGGALLGQVDGKVTQFILFATIWTKLCIVEDLNTGALQNECVSAGVNKGNTMIRQTRKAHGGHAPRTRICKLLKVTNLQHNPYDVCNSCPRRSKIHFGHRSLQSWPFHQQKRLTESFTAYYAASCLAQVQQRLSLVSLHPSRQNRVFHKILCRRIQGLHLTFVFWTPRSTRMTVSRVLLDCSDIRRASVAARKLPILYKGIFIIFASVSLQTRPGACHVHTKSRKQPR